MEPGSQFVHGVHEAASVVVEYPLTLKQEVQTRSLVAVPAVWM